LAPIWPALDEFTEANKEHLAGLGRRIFECSWLNPVIPEDVYYVHALAVTEGHRGEGIGAALLRNAIDHAQEIELKGLQLDVLSGNPAVDFYRSFGLEVLVESTVPSAFAKGVPTELRMGMRF
jgi:ribosomal protein S18 acetylase RimI-like enzyme